MANVDEIKQRILDDLPTVLKEDASFRDAILDLMRDRFADKAHTESRFDRILDELRRDREEESRRWDEDNQRWKEQAKRWEEQNRRWEEQNRRWEEQDRLWAEYRMEREKNERRWEESHQEINRILDRQDRLDRKYDSTIGALGARWGLHSEESFRSALRGILEEDFPVQVQRVLEYDKEGEVFGRPDQVEIDIIIRNGMVIACEIKSSISKSEMYTFEKKVRFYEKRHKTKVQRMIVISPMVDPHARHVADILGIKVYSYPDSVEPAVFE